MDAKIIPTEVNPHFLLLNPKALKAPPLAEKPRVSRAAKKDKADPPLTAKENPDGPDHNSAVGVKTQNKLQETKTTGAEDIRQEAQAEYQAEAKSERNLSKGP